MKTKINNWMELWVGTFFYYLEKATPTILILGGLYFITHFTIFLITK
jgi:hypothetical protein